MRNNIIPLLILLCALGCISRLEPGGAYAPVNAAGVAVPDKPFLIADAAYQIAHKSGLAVFQFEKDNRLALWKISPSIKHTLDKWRPQFDKANKDYLTQRHVYKLNPCTENLDTLTGLLQKLQQVTTTVQSVSLKGL